MRTKLLISAKAMFFDIRMAVASPVQEIDPTLDFIWMDGSFIPLGKAINCGTGYPICEVRIPNGQLKEVYDATDPHSIKTISIKGLDEKG